MRGSRRRNLSPTRLRLRSPAGAFGRTARPTVSMPRPHTLFGQKTHPELPDGAWQMVHRAVSQLRTSLKTPATSYTQQNWMNSAHMAPRPRASNSIQYTVHDSVHSQQRCSGPLQARLKYNWPFQVSVVTAVIAQYQRGTRRWSLGLPAMSASDTTQYAAASTSHEVLNPHGGRTSWT